MPNKNYGDSLLNTANRHHYFWDHAFADSGGFGKKSLMGRRLPDVCVFAVSEADYCPPSKPGHERRRGKNSIADGCMTL